MVHTEQDENTIMQSARAGGYSQRYNATCPNVEDSSMHDDIMQKARKALNQYKEYKHEYSQIIHDTLSKSQMRQQTLLHNNQFFNHSPLDYEGTIMSQRTMRA